MSEFPHFEYSMGDVRRAGEALAGNLIWTEESADRIREIFRIANNWRDSHALPIGRLRYELIGQVRRLRGLPAPVGRGWLAEKGRRHARANGLAFSRTAPSCFA